MLLPIKYIKALKRLAATGLIRMSVIDLETAPCVAYVWSTGEQYVSYKQIKQGVRIITAQYIDFFEKKAKFLEWDWDGVTGGNDKSLVEEFTNFANDYDIVIGQNSKSFDYKVLQERARHHRTTPLNIDFMIDTKTASSSSFRNLSHSLDCRMKQYGLGGKHHMEMQDWINIVEGKVAPSKKMIPYGLKDVIDTQKLFWLDLPYYNLPAATVNKIKKLVDKYILRLVCKECEKRRQSKYDCYIISNKSFCNNCGTKRKLTKEEKVLL